MALRASFKVKEVYLSVTVGVYENIPLLRTTKKKVEDQATLIMPCCGDPVGQWCGIKDVTGLRALSVFFQHNDP